MYENVDLHDLHTAGQGNATQGASESLPVEPNVAYHSVQPPPSVEDPYYETV